MRLDEFGASFTRFLKCSVLAFASICLFIAPGASAQDSEEEEAADDIEEVVVTGSRLKRDTYSSIAPLQIITGQVSREVGLIDAADILQESTASSGQQIDLTFQGFVLDNGPSASTINLRGLGEARTLVLVNGRRLAPAGVEGAPFAANLNQVPASLVQQYDLLLDGASSVYGSDALAGVANVILRKDFDGVEVEAYHTVPKYSGGIESTLSVVWGKNFDRGFIGGGIERVDTERVRLRDRPWTDGCEKHHEIDQYGEIRSQEVYYPDIFGMEWDECRFDLVASRVFQYGLSSASIYYTPGFGNGGWGDWSESESFGFPIDSNLDGVADLSYRDYDLNGSDAQLNSDLFPETSATSFMAFGEYTFEGEANITPYFEVMYNDYDFLSNSAEGQFFPDVPALNPYNLCNPDAITGLGVDCGLAQDALYTSPHYEAQFSATYGGLCAFYASIGFLAPDAPCTPAGTQGLFGLLSGSTGPIRTQPIVSVRGDRNFADIAGDQLRVVGGVRGDMPFMTFGSLDNWSFDVYYSFTTSEATSRREGIRQDRADLALGVYSTTNTPCEIDDFTVTSPDTGLTAAELGSDVAPGCVPINLFAPSLYPNKAIGDGGVTGDFATAAERDYLFDGRDFETEYEQSLISAYVTGDIFELPGGSAALGLGYEYRNDTLNSLPDDVARDGLLFGFFRDGGAIGEKDTEELFAELELPLLAGVTAFEELTLNASIRRTEDEYYGKNNTRSFKLGWRPIESLLIRGTFGTAFRAPNLRELLLVSQTGFTSVFDPCLIPENALDFNDNYLPEADDREPEVLANCLANGVDPTAFDNGGFNVLSTEVSRRGSTTVGAPRLEPEESESWSAGIAWDQPFTNAFDLSIGATYYEISIDNTIVEPTAQFAVNSCYYSRTIGASIFCDYVERASNPVFPRITLVDLVFLNRNNETARGVDINVAYDDTLTIFERPVDVALDITANRNLERSTLFIDGQGNVDFNTFQGEWGFPEWNVRAGIRLNYADYRLTWETRYLSSVNQEPDFVDDFDIADTTFGGTCLGYDLGDVLCRDYADIDNYFLHNVSLYYYGDQWTFGGGVRNVLNEKPPVIDGDEFGFSINNTPIGYGYDVNGRTFFLNVAVNFGGGE